MPIPNLVRCRKGEKPGNLLDIGRHCGRVRLMGTQAERDRLEAEAWATETLGIRLSDPALLMMALTHKSARSATSYERLEFLGDRILGAVIAADLYQKYPKEPEGKLTRRFHTLVSGETCAAVARAHHVGSYVRMDAQARADGGVDSDNILGDVVEALIGALWLDQGWESAGQAVRRWWSGQSGQVGSAQKHPKSALQEWALARGRRTPVYELAGRSGAHHAPNFHVRLRVGDLPPVEAEGSSKQEAETRAAQAFLETHGGE